MTKEDAIKYLQQLYPNGGHCWLDEQRIEAISMAIDALQEVPAPKILQDMLNAKTAAESLGISPEEYDKIVDKCLYGKEPELVDVDDLPNKEEEPVSEDLEEAACKHVKEYFDMLGIKVDDNPIEAGKAILDFEAGAKWQFSQLEKNRLAACDRQTDEEREREQDFVEKVLVGEHRQPTFSDAIEYGMKLQKIQTLKDIKEKIYRVIDFREKNNEKPHDDVYSILGHVILIEDTIEKL